MCPMPCPCKPPLLTTTSPRSTCASTVRVAVSAPCLGSTMATVAAVPDTAVPLPQVDIQAIATIATLQSLTLSGEMYASLADQDEEDEEDEEGSNSPPWTCHGWEPCTTCASSTCRACIGVIKDTSTICTLGAAAAVATPMAAAVPEVIAKPPRPAWRSCCCHWESTWMAQACMRWLACGSWPACLQRLTAGPAMRSRHAPLRRCR